MNSDATSLISARRNRFRFDSSHAGALSRILPLLTFLLVATCAMAQLPQEHAVLNVTGDRQMLQALEMEIAAEGGRVAVKSGDTWVIRLSPPLKQRLRFDERVVRLLDAPIRPGSAGSDLAALLMEPDGQSEQDHHQMHLPDGDCSDGERQDVDAEQVLRLMRTPEKDRPAILSGPGTSESVVGSTTVALFYLSNDGSVDPVVVQTTPQLQTSIEANVIRNLAWWSDQAAFYGHTATFNLKTYGFDDPITRLSFDPTKTTPAGQMLRNLGTHDTVMARLGYAGPPATRIARMVAYLNDLRIEEETDWAFAAFIVTGANAIRSNASFNGPVTNVWYQAANSGYIFAHEAGHIFGAFDEYYEEGTEYSRSRQSRFEAPNGNFQFRNFPTVPCMMRSNMVAGICAFTAVHVGLHDSVEHTIVATEPAGAIFEIRYPREDGTVTGTAERFQGKTMFPWGRGMNIRLYGLPSTAANSPDDYGSPIWQSSGDNIADHISTGSGDLRVRYAPTGRSSTERWEYLAPGIGPAGARVLGIVPTGSRSAVIISSNGIAIISPEGRVLLDPPFVGSRMENDLRFGLSVARGPDGAFYFGTQSSEILRVVGTTVERLVGPVAFQRYNAVAVTPDGVLWGGSEAGLHRFRERGHDIFTMATAPMLATSVTQLAVDGSGRLLVGYLAGRSGGSSGLQRFDPVADTWEDLTAHLPGADVRSIRIWGDSIGVATATGFAIFDGAAWRSYPGSMVRPGGNVYDITRAPSGDIWIATLSGVGRLATDGTWRSYTVAGSELQSDFTTAIATGADGSIWIGTMAGTVAIMSDQQMATRVTAAGGNAGRLLLHGSQPNPFDRSTAVAFSIPERGEIRLRVVDLRGIERLPAVRAMIDAGEHRIEIAAADLEEGIYLYTIEFEGEARSGRLVVVRK